MMLECWSELPEIKICVAYELDGRRITDFPSQVDDCGRRAGVRDVARLAQRRSAAFPGSRTCRWMGAGISSGSANCSAAGRNRIGRSRSSADGICGAKGRGEGKGKLRAEELGIFQQCAMLSDKSLLHTSYSPLTTTTGRVIRPKHLPMLDDIPHKSSPGTSPSSWTATGGGPAAGAAADRGPSRRRDQRRRVTEEAPGWASSS